MTFNSLQFILFFILVVFFYYVLPHKLRWILLLTASYYAYMSWNPLLVFLLLGNTVVSYTAGILMPKAKTRAVKKILLSVTILICLGTLIYFKYFNFLLKSVTDFLNLFALNLQNPVLDIILPIGISFYTFQTLSYVIDIYRGTITPEKHFGYYALFVSFFPQLIAGPIERPSKLLPQLKEKHNFNKEDAAAGFRMMLSGFFRKCVVADLCGIFVNSVFGDVANANSLSLIVASLLFAMQIYCDFAGYSEIAMGAARIMGIHLTRNFDRPFSALSKSEMMSRWHITLSTWLRDYIYIPLGGNRGGKIRHILNILIVYAICGLWHGANWTYVLWGIFVGIIVVLENLLKTPFTMLLNKWRISKNSIPIVILRRTYFIVVVVVVAIIFRAESIAQIGEIFMQIFTSTGFGMEYMSAAMTSLSIEIINIVEIALILIILLYIRSFADYSNKRVFSPLLPDEIAATRSAQLNSISNACYIFLAVVLGLIALLGSGGTSAFVYFQF